jgi:hypothetical protein
VENLPAIARSSSSIVRRPQYLNRIAFGKDLSMNASRFISAVVSSGNRTLASMLIASCFSGFSPAQQPPAQQPPALQPPALPPMGPPRAKRPAALPATDLEVESQPRGNENAASPAGPGRDKQQGVDDEPQATEAPKDPAAAIKRQLDKIEAKLRGDDQAADASTQTLRKLIKGLEQEYHANHDELLRLRDIPDPSVHRDERKKLVRRQKIIAQHLIELDTRQSSHVVFDNDQYRALAKLQQRREVMTDPALQRRVTNLLQVMMQSRQGARQQIIKTIAEITFPLVGDDHLALHEVAAANVYPAATHGVLQDYGRHVSRLIRIQWNGRQLELDRHHWDQPFAGKTDREIAKEVDALLTDRGYKAPLVANRGRMAMFRGNPQGRSNLARVFSAMQQGRPIGSSPLGGNNNHQRLSMRTKLMEARLTSDPGSFTFDFIENDARAAMLRIRENKDTGLSIAFVGDVLFRFKQSADGAVEVVEMAGDETMRYTAPSFAEFYRDHVDYCEVRFLPLLDYLGITIPMSRLDERVVQCVIAELQALAEHRSDDVQQLIEQLGSKEYAQREAAAQMLKEGIVRYAPSMRVALGESLSVEARMRIKSLLQHSQGNQTEEMVAALKLLEDVEYLKVVRTRCADDDQEMVASRIEQLTLE